jgi:hypothetical protein
MDWYQNDRGDQVLGVEDDALRFIFDMIETDSSSAEISVELLDSVCQNWDSSVPILEVITDHGSEFINMHQDDRPCIDHVTPTGIGTVLCIPLSIHPTGINGRTGSNSLG